MTNKTWPRAPYFIYTRKCASVSTTEMAWSSYSLILCAGICAIRWYVRLAWTVYFFWRLACVCRPLEYRRRQLFALAWQLSWFVTANLFYNKKIVLYERKMGRYVGRPTTDPFIKKDGRTDPHKQKTNKAHVRLDRLIEIALSIMWMYISRWKKTSRQCLFRVTIVINRTFLFFQEIKPIVS